jgi:hypothetical protein
MLFELALHSRAVDEMFTHFMSFGRCLRLELPPMNKKQRVMVHQLSQLYHLQSKSYGMGMLSPGLSPPHRYAHAHALCRTSPVPHPRQDGLFLLSSSSRAA